MSDDIQKTQDSAIFAILREHNVLRSGGGRSGSDMDTFRDTDEDNEHDLTIGGVLVHAFAWGRVTLGAVSSYTIAEMESVLGIEFDQIEFMVDMVDGCLYTHVWIAFSPPDTDAPDLIDGPHAASAT